MPYDLIVRNGMIVDGSGQVPFPADLGVSNGRIAFIGRIRERGDQEVDAEGHAVTPGFVDGHTHMDAQFFWDELGSCSSWHGVTTVVMGNCGFTLAPSREGERELVLRNLVRAEDIPAEAMAAGIDWSWSSFREYLEVLDAAPKAINYAANIGHSALRTWAMGERAFEGPARQEDLAAMERELRDAITAGAIGFTSSRSNHETSDGRPVASRFAGWEEIRQLVGAMGDMGRGVFQLQPESVVHSDDVEARNEFLDRLRELAVRTRVPCTHGVAPRESGLAILAHMEGTVAAGGRMFGLASGRGTSVMLSFRTRLPFDVLPEWKAVRTLPLAQQERILRDPIERDRLVKAAHAGDYGAAVGTESRPPNYDLMAVVERPLPPNPTVADLARARGIDPVELIIDLGLESNFHQFFEQPIVPFTRDDMLAVMRHRRTVTTFSDAGAHVSQILGYSLQTYLLAYWMREQQAFTLAEAVKMLTSAPARAFGFADRGLLQEGLLADINVFDPEIVGPEMPTVVRDLPAGATRLMQRAIGFRATIVGGEVTFLDGEHTGALPGVLIRGR